MTRGGPSTRTQLLRPLTLTAVMFFTVSGGPYGLEPLLYYVGGHTALLLVLVLPVLWCLPAMLMVLELNGMMPINGGYYQWVKTALGPFWGFQEGWWSWIFSFVDLAIYPVLFVEYLSFFFPDIGPYRIPLCLAIVWAGAGLNLLGIIPVGRSSVVLGLAVLIPFLVLFGAGLSRMNTGAITAASSLPESSAFAMAMFTVMWNYLGWDNGSPYAGEVHEPVRSYGWSLAASFLLIVGMYVLAVFTSTTTGMDARVLQDEGYPALGSHVGGWWLGALVSAGGLASTLGLFLSVLLSISRVPAVMADDGFLPRSLSRVNPRDGAPYVSILLCAVIVSGMVLWKFDELLIIDVTLYSTALFLEFSSLVALRRSAPGVRRPFRIPLGVPGLVVLALVPGSCLLLALYGVVITSDIHANAVIFTGAAILSGPAAWGVVRWRKPEMAMPAPALPAQAAGDPPRGT